MGGAIAGGASSVIGGLFAVMSGQWPDFQAVQLLYPAISGIQPETSWAGVDYETADGLPLLGPHRNYPRHLFAYGSARHGSGLAWVAARLALRHVLGEPAGADAALGFTRIL